MAFALLVDLHKVNALRQRAPEGTKSLHHIFVDQHTLVPQAHLLEQPDLRVEFNVS
jgi:hypothetical protein